METSSKYETFQIDCPDLENVLDLVASPRTHPPESPKPEDNMSKKDSKRQSYNTVSSDSATSSFQQTEITEEQTSRDLQWEWCKNSKSLLQDDYRPQRKRASGQ
ncbi:hypothetical protein BZG36_05026 [Bifiguratus adelaidae]|uniref:Uncharacterized protein n=1 Tax=Bifiguratus adelaidae TaxID=1938954 RepID=A0A261XXV5_9FUNG|nr:hypothetical protein BZG36_05026 [Bifiguratus adelaidae]